MALPFPHLPETGVWGRHWSMKTEVRLFLSSSLTVPATAAAQELNSRKLGDHDP